MLSLKSDCWRLPFSPPPAAKPSCTLDTTRSVHMLPPKANPFTTPTCPVLSPLKPNMSNPNFTQRPLCFSAVLYLRKVRLREVASCDSFDYRRDPPNEWLIRALNGLLLWDGMGWAWSDGCCRSGRGCGLLLSLLFVSGLPLSNPPLTPSVPSDEEGWTRVSKKGSADSSNKKLSHKPYMMGMASVKVNFVPDARFSADSFTHTDDAPPAPVKALSPRADMGLPPSDDETLGWCKDVNASASMAAPPSAAAALRNAEPAIDIDKLVPIVDPATGRTVILSSNDESYGDKPNMSPSQSQIRRFKALGIRSSGGSTEAGRHHGHKHLDDSASSYPKKRKN